MYRCEIIINPISLHDTLTLQYASFAIILNFV